MEGRAIARPNLFINPDTMTLTRPSMEGRAIARPNATVLQTYRASGHSFNGGPGNCPAKHAVIERINQIDQLPSMEGRAIARPNIERALRVATLHALQWRAGQLPGQT